jgi:trypsin-like peptidase
VTSRLLCFAPLLAILSACVQHRIIRDPPPPAPTFIRAIDALKRSVAPVICVTVAADGSAHLDFIEGSAFFISKEGAFVTARHVISELEPSSARRPCNTPAVYVPMSGKWSDDGRFVNIKWFAFRAGECTLSSVAADLARCKTQDDLSRDKEITVPPAPVIVDAALPPEGTEIAFMGFPLQIVIPRTARGFIAGYGSRDNKETTDMVLDRNAWPGASGSAVFTSNGHIIGVLLARGTNDAMGLAFARTGNQLDQFLSGTTH